MTDRVPGVVLFATAFLGGIATHLLFSAPRYECSPVIYAVGGGLTVIVDRYYP